MVTFQFSYIKGLSTYRSESYFDIGIKLIIASLYKQVKK